MHVVDAVVHDRRCDILASDTHRPGGFHVEIEIRFAVTLARVLLQIDGSVRAASVSIVFDHKKLVVVEYQSVR